MLTMLIIIGSHVAGGRRFCSVTFFMPPIFVFNLYSDYIRRKSARQESSTTVWRTKATSSHGHFRLAVTVTAYLSVAVCKDTEEIKDAELLLQLGIK